MKNEKFKFVEKRVFKRECRELNPWIYSFIPAWDSTDHFLWVCKNCKHVAKVCNVFTINKKGVGPTLYFILCCERCKNKGQRKIYLMNSDKDVVGEVIATQTESLYNLLKDE
jgi:hypothetical protein